MPAIEPPPVSASVPLAAPSTPVLFTTMEMLLMPVPPVLLSVPALVKTSRPPLPVPRVPSSSMK